MRGAAFETAGPDWVRPCTEVGSFVLEELLSKVGERSWTMLHAVCMAVGLVVFNTAWRHDPTENAQEARGKR